MDITIKQAGAKDRTLIAHEGQTILSFLANQGLHVDAPCAGRGKCGTCRIKATGEISETTANEAAVAAMGEGERLA